MIASRHDDLPVTFATFANGELAIDQIAQVARYTAPHNDAEACYLATQATVIQLRSALSRHQPAWHPTTGADTHDDDAKPRDDASPATTLSLRPVRALRTLAMTPARPTWRQRILVG